MTQHLHRDLERVRRHVLRMGELAQDALQCARTTFDSLDRADLTPLRSFEKSIDNLQVEIDDEILKVLALHQPVAGDLRFLMAALKIVNDLERIGDLTVNIADRMERLVKAPAPFEPITLGGMLDLTASMLNDSLHAFIGLDSKLARSVLTRDDTVDKLNAGNYEALIVRMQDAPDQVESSVALLAISRSVERIADLATNIAEDVIFIVDATDVRHNPPPAS